jgi:hypothetical protein
LHLSPRHLGCFVNNSRPESCPSRQPLISSPHPPPFLSNANDTHDCTHSSPVTCSPTPESVHYLRLRCPGINVCVLFVHADLRGAMSCTSIHNGETMYCKSNPERLRARAASPLQCSARPSCLYPKLHINFFHLSLFDTQVFLW